MNVYIELFHGRKDLDMDMDDWGDPGPVIGPFRYFHTTYASEIKFGEGCVLNIVEDCVYYDGMYYGDWSVFGSEVALHPELKERMVTFDPLKAIPPAIRKKPQKRYIEYLDKTISHENHAL